MWLCQFLLEPHETQHQELVFGLSKTPGGPAPNTLSQKSLPDSHIQLGLVCQQNPPEFNEVCKQTC